MNFIHLLHIGIKYSRKTLWLVMPKKKQSKVDHCAVDPQFEALWDYIGNPEDGAPSVGELVLWRKVILRAKFDFCSIQATAAARFSRYEAERWFLSGRDFLFVCQLADIDGRRLREIIRLAKKSRSAMKKLRDSLTWC